MNLELIKKEIDSRKKEKNHIAESTGIDMPMAKDNFLRGLEESLKTGVPNKATAKLKVVNERAENIQVTDHGVVNKNTTPINHQVLNEIAQTKQPVNYYQPPVDPNALDPREEQFYKNLQETKQLLGANNNMGMADALSLYQKQQAPQGQQFISSPNALNEAVKREVNNYLANIDLEKMIEDVVKHTMMEMYQRERVEAALNENKEMIQKMVVNTIIALKNRNNKQTTK